MKTQIVSIEYETDQDMQMTVLAESADPVIAARFLAGVYEACKQVAAAAPGLEEAVHKKHFRKGTEVTVTRIAHPDLCPSGVTVGESYESAMTLSQLLGYSYNAVGQALCRAASKDLPCATLRGVTFEQTERSAENEQ